MSDATYPPAPAPVRLPDGAPPPGAPGTPVVPPQSVAAAPPPAADGHRVPTRAEARAKREEEQAGYWLPLRRTGGHIHVRALSVADKNTLAGLPTAMQRRVLDVFAESSRQPTRAATVEQWEKNRERVETMANAVCLAAAIRPRLYEREEDIPADDPEAMLVADLHIDERIYVLNFVLGQLGEEEVARLEPFRQPEVGVVGHLPAGTPAAAAG